VTLAGTGKVTEKLPTLLLLGEGGAVVCAVPSKVSETALDAAKPLPVTVTVSPTWVVAGERVSFELTVKVAEALLADPSEAATVCEPFVLAGTVNETPLKPPLASVVGDSGEVVWPEPSKETPMALDAAKPVPETVAESPTFPDAAERVIVGVTVKVAFAVCPPAVTTTVLAPAGLAGTTNAAPEKEPVASVEVAGLMVTGAPS
jgi:hypothetical protein